MSVTVDSMPLPLPFQHYDATLSDDMIGLDYDSAVDAMPHWYGVSFGNGNDGVSHTFASYYVRTCDPWTLAAAAMLSDFKEGKGQDWALEAMEIDGEAEYTISATIYDPPDDNESGDESDGESDESFDDESWSSVNGAWMICDVFRVQPDDMGRAWKYTSLDDAYSESLLTLARTA